MCRCLKTGDFGPGFAAGKDKDLENRNMKLPRLANQPSQTFISVLLVFSLFAFLHFPFWKTPLSGERRESEAGSTKQR